MKNIYRKPTLSKVAATLQKVTANGPITGPVEEIPVPTP